MGIRQFFQKTTIGFINRRSAVAPTINRSEYDIAQDDNTNAFIAGHENYYDYADLPNIMGPLNTDAAFHDPQSEHAPFVRRRNDEYILTDSGKHFFDGANPNTMAPYRSELQHTFDQKREIPVPPALVPASGVFVPAQRYNYGWSQVHVPDNGDSYSASVVKAPHIKLSHPINVVTHTGAVAGMDSVTRPSIKKTAPRQRRG